MRRVVFMCLLTAGAIVAFFGLMAGVLWLRLSGTGPARVASTSAPAVASATKPFELDTAPVAPARSDADTPPARPMLPADSDATPVPPVDGPVGQVMRLALVDVDSGDVVG